MKSKRKALVNKLDKIHSQLIRSLGSQCVVCGTSENLSCGHLFSRVSYSTRWDIEPKGNCYTQCLSCNMKHEYDPYPYFNWYINKFGKEEFDNLHIRFKQIRKYKDFELEELINNYKNLLQEYT